MRHIHVYIFIHTHFMYLCGNIRLCLTLASTVVDCRGSELHVMVLRLTNHLLCSIKKHICTGMYLIISCNSSKNICH